MKTAARIWLIAALTECLIYAFIFKGIEAIPIVAIIALVGGFPGMLALAFGIELIHMIWEEGNKKWQAIFLLTLFASNGTLCLFLLLISADFSHLDLPYFLVVNVAALTGFFCSLSSIRKHYFSPEPEPTDVTHQSPYQFNQDYDKN
ncbi:hypothetical protein [Edaphocola aurantiacus]|uniref:hypothetical protein n=1 Tax=Edaphocola aurantiacus TaxID=2601682 RepID=UPI001C95F293|nr:hypothetical protein [Edaphocola aurantiacus]